MTAHHGATKKTAAEIASLARGGAILRTVLEDLAALAKPGVTGSALNVEAEKRLRARGAEPSFLGYAPTGKPEDAFPASLCVSVNEAIVHGMPNDVPFRSGDIVGLDLGCVYEGFYTDTALTMGIGRVAPQAKKLIAVTRQALASAIAIVRPGIRTGDIGATVQELVEAEGFSLVRDLTGHGVGYAVHEDPRIPNFGRRGEGTLLEEGMVIAIEPMVFVGKHEIEVAADGWTIVSKDRTLGAHEEHTVAITNTGARVLTHAGAT
jgi:methionyl aminopeptidase